MATISSDNYQNKLNKKNDIHAKLAQKFGQDKIDSITKTKELSSQAELVELSGKTKEVKSFATPMQMVNIGSNDPNSQETQDKLKFLLQTGAFQFSEKEKEALQQILK